MSDDRPPDLDAIAAIAETALKGLPQLFRDNLQGVAIRVDDFPDDDVLRDLEIDSPFDLLGLYSGSPLGEKATGGAPAPDQIFLYRRPILEEWIESGDSLAHIVRHVL
ncbi:MAG: metallopeptidase family protein, partial [Pseudomonadota bacterium]